MLYLYKLQLNNKEVKIRSQDKIDQSELEKIQNKLIIIQKESNHNISDSSSFRFNELSVNSGEDFNEIFVEFLEINLKLSQSYFPRFSSLKPIFTSDPVEIDGNFIYKKSDLVLDTSYLRTNFAIEHIKNYLIQKLELNSFCIEYESLFTAYGNKEWIISHPLIKNAFGINDESIYLTPYQFSNKLSKNFIPDAIIFISDDCYINKIESLIFPELLTIEDYKNYCEENSIKIVFINEDTSVALGF